LDNCQLELAALLLFAKPFSGKKNLNEPFIFLAVTAEEQGLLGISVLCFESDLSKGADGG